MYALKKLTLDLHRPEILGSFLTQYPYPFRIPNKVKGWCARVGKAIALDAGGDPREAQKFSKIILNILGRIISSVHPTR